MAKRKKVNNRDNKCGTGQEKCPECKGNKIIVEKKHRYQKGMMPLKNCHMCGGTGLITPANLALTAR